MEIVNVYEELGSYRATAELCGTSPKTVRRVIERRRATTAGSGRPLRAHNTDGVEALVEERVRATDGRLSAKRLLPVAVAAGYQGSARNFRRAVATAKAIWRRERRVYRPWVPVPGEHLVMDWGTEGTWQLFCAVLPWSRYRFVRFATNQQRETTLALLAECLALIGGVPKRPKGTRLADRMGCLKGGVVANVVVPHPDYVRFATHYGFRPDFCEARDPESKGVVEALVGYAKTDLVVPAGGWPSVVEANAAATAWCAEVNSRLHSEIAAVPTARLATEGSVLRPLPTLRVSPPAGVLRKVDRLGTVRFGSARYSVPTELVGQSVELVVQGGMVLVVRAGAEVARHLIVAPGEVALIDAHYGGPRSAPARAIRPRAEQEVAFLALGPIAEQFLRTAAAAGTSRLQSELAAIVALEAAWGRTALLAALERALQFHRFRADDVRSILMAGAGVATPVPAGESLPMALGLPTVPTRSLDAYALAEVLR
jgi:hypothetical protein